VNSDLAFALRGVSSAISGDFALRDVSFELPTGYVMGLIGANGAGKTTTIRCLLGMRGFQAGEIELLGHRVPGPVALRQDIGVVLDHTYLVGEWRLAEAERALRPFYDRWDGARYRQLLGDFGLDLRARVKDLSRGMAVKFMITVALSHQARLLVFAEPTSGLDPAVAADRRRMRYGRPNRDDTSLAPGALAFPRRRGADRAGTGPGEMPAASSESRTS
jgi:ABC-2 type transport system ATP-binding protein